MIMHDYADNCGIQSLPWKLLGKTLVNETKRSFFASSMYIVHLRDSSLKLRFNKTEKQITPTLKYIKRTLILVSRPMEMGGLLYQDGELVAKEWRLYIV
jgi:hypothetical protein